MKILATSRTMRNFAAAIMFSATGLALTAAPTLAGKHNGHYNKHTVTKKASFHTLKHHARKVHKTGVAKVTKIKRQGKVVGFKKTYKSGDKVIVRRGKHGRVHHTTLKRKTFLQRVKHRVSSATKAFKAKAKRLHVSVLGKKRYARH